MKVPAPIETAWNALRQRVRGSIGVRMVTVFLALLLAVQVVTFVATRASLERHARSTLPEQLLVGERVVQALLAQRAARLIEDARLLAADYGFRTAVQSDDAATIESVLDNHGARIGAAEAAFLTADFQLKAISARGATPMRDVAAIAHGLAAQAAAQQVASDVALINGLPHQVVLVPMRAPVTVGWVLMGFPIDEQLAVDFRNLSALDLTLLTQRRADAPWQVALSHLPGERSQALAQQATVVGEHAAASGTRLHELTLVDELRGLRGHWVVRQAAQASGTGMPQAGEEATGKVLAVVSVSIDDAVRMPADLQLALLLITLLGFGVFAAGGIASVRRITTPLRRLAAAAERLGTGDLTTPMRGLARHDEVGQLSQAFEHMRINLGDKQAEVLKLAYWDSLTGLPNRVQFRNAVRDAVAHARQHRHSVAVLMLDLDRFKHVNDVLGSRFGDLLLGRVAERLTQQTVRGDDLVARLGGDEFAVLLRHGDGPLAQAVALRLTHTFDEPLLLEEHTVDMGAGIGMACWPEHADDADTLLGRAEIAMYAAKRRAGGPLMYDAAVDASSSQTLSLLTELRHAIERGELRLYLQPKLALETGTVVGAEALVRWQHPQRGLVPPLQFIPFAEQTGFIRTLTQWVFEEAARQWQVLHDAGIEITLSVNLSTRDLLDQDLPQKFDALLVRHRVPAEGFCLEITESAIMDDPVRAQATLDKLSALGFKLSIDDFGTGYSSLAYLKRLPVDELKIDQSFVKNMECDQDDAKIVRSTIDLAHNLGLAVVAEGVETAKVWNMLRELNCDVAQGYHMGKPMPSNEFKPWCGAWLARQRPAGAPNALTLH